MKYSDLQRIIKEFKGRDLAMEIFRYSLVKQQKQLFDLLPFGIEKAKTCKEIADAIGIETKNASAQLKQLQDKFGLIKTVKVNKKRKYYI